MNKKKTTGIVLSVVGVLSLVLITAGVTYAFFSYAKEGTTLNTISTGTITFLYDEQNREGNGIEITDALPMTDDKGMVLSGSKNVFDFKVTATTTGKTSIPYEVTARMKKDSDASLADQIKLYLTTVDSTSNETAAESTLDNGKVKTFGSLTQSSKVDASVATEKTIYNGEVPADSKNYSQDFRLRMWLAGDTTEGGVDTDYSPLEFKKTDGTLITSTAYYALSDTEKAQYTRIAYVDNTNKVALTQAEYDALTSEEEKAKYEASEQLYLYNARSFTVTVNVYANATVVNAGV